MLLYFVIFAVMCIGGIGGFPNVEIANGRDSKTAEAPYAVSIRVEDCHRCGGSIIAESWILTTAYCIQPDQVYTVLYGTIHKYDCESAPHNTKRISHKVIHPEYKKNERNMYNDVALAKVETSFVFNEKVKKILLPNNQEVLPPEKSTIVGWGLEYNDDTLEDILQVIEIELIGTWSLFDKFIYIESKDKSIVEKICLDDDGGPLIINNIQYGIIPSLNTLQKDFDFLSRNNINDYPDSHLDGNLKVKVVADSDVNSNHNSDEDSDNDSEQYSDCYRPWYFISTKYYIKWINEII